ncbi:MAG: hypothetical protein J1F38_10315 [Muribaculaceae bacterium]|nr:hypothetical protein [Muribaculaceae bacterium]
MKGKIMKRGYPVSRIGKRKPGVVALFVCMLLWSLLIAFPIQVSGKKIKNSFKIEKEKKTDKKRDKRGEDQVFEGIEIPMNDTVGSFQLHFAGIEKEDSDILVQQIRKCGFAGYDKEPNSDVESFILINNSENPITGYDVRIDYLDMEGRMLHSRRVKEGCYVPAGETRRFDIKSWDKQRTYYYYLGNSPRRVATPYQVRFSPQYLWISEPESAQLTKDTNR